MVMTGLGTSGFARIFHQPEKLYLVLEVFSGGDMPGPGTRKADGTRRGYVKISHADGSTACAANHPVL
jgi:hypothetical protein